jgi:multidrug efflux system membrane fusion protein
MHVSPVRAVACACLAAAVAALGCQHRTPQGPADSEPPAVPVSKPVQRQVTDFADFTGRTDAIEAVDVRARVTGYLVKLAFKEGSVVKKGDLLFEIDPRPYQAQLDQAQAQVKLNQASLDLAQATLARDRRIAAEVSGGVSQQQLDQDRATVEEAKARVVAYKASLETYKLNLSFTRVESPIDGKVSRFFLTRGNLVLQDQTLLTTVVSLDPVYAYFDVDEATLLRVRRAINEGRIKRPETGEFPVSMGLQGEDGFPHEGKVDFVNNQVNPTTGSITVRGVFANPLPPKGARLISPGMFVRIRVPIGQPYQALLVIDRAIGSDQGLKFVYVLGADNTAQYHRVRTGPLQPDGLRVVEGLKPDDLVVVGALPQVRPKMTIRPDRIDMPTLAGRPQPGDKGDKGAPGKGDGKTKRP